MNASHPRTRRPRMAVALVAGLAASLLPALGPAAAGTPADSAAAVRLVGAVEAAGPAAQGRKRFWKRVGTENFSRFNAARWGRFDGTPGCCHDAEWDPSMVKVRGGKLQLHTAPRNGRWLSGGVGGWGWDAAVRTYGRYDARIRFDRGAGVSAAALLWPSGDGWPPELDFYEIFESWGDRKQMSVTTHWRQNGQHESSRRVVKRDFTRWHTASVRWRRDRVAYYLDGRRIKVDRAPARIPRSRMWVGFQTHAHKMNGRYVPLPRGRSSVALEVDWVRVYRQNR
jgi:hypothetical protein